MSDEDDINPEDMEFPGETEQDAAFADSGNKVFDGKPLNPYVAKHRAAAQRLGMRYGRLTSEDVEIFKATGEYPGLDLDVFIFMWLVGKATMFEILKAQRLPDWGLEQVFAFADKLKLTKRDRFEEAAFLFGKTMAELNASSGEFESAGKSSGRKRGNSSPRPAKRRSSSR